MGQMQFLHAGFPVYLVYFLHIEIKLNQTYDKKTRSGSQIPAVVHLEGRGFLGLRPFRGEHF